MTFPCPTSVPDRLLFLQGPVGSYFQNLADYWSQHHKTIIKVNFNAGDDFFYKQGTILRFQESPENLLDFYKTTIKSFNIQAVILFGDCRPIHKLAIYICEQM